MSIGEELVPPPLCQTCGHSSLSTCNECGGPQGMPSLGLGICQRCRSRIAAETEAPTDVLDVSAISGQMNNFATTELTDPEAVEHILTLGDGLGPDELPPYRTPPDVVAELVPRMPSYRELWGQALTRLGLLDGIAPDEARNAAMDALRMITDRYRERAGS